jgi:hypothetical protein
MFIRKSTLLAFREFIQQVNKIVSYGVVEESPRGKKVKIILKERKRPFSVAPQRAISRGLSPKVSNAAGYTHLGEAARGSCAEFAMCNKTFAPFLSWVAICPGG